MPVSIVSPLTASKLNVSNILYPQFRAQNEATKYPFGAAATLTNRSGDVILDSLLLDAHLYPVGGQDGMYLSTVVVAADTVTFVLGDSASTSIAAGKFNRIDPPDSVQLLDSYGRPAGILVSERARLASFSSWAEGQHDFTQDATEFSATCCMPTPEIGVRGILLEDGSILQGQLWLVGDAGIVLSHSDELYRTRDGNDVLVSVIRVDIVGDPLFRQRLCDQSDVYTPVQLVRKLRVIGRQENFVCEPDAAGNIAIQAANLLAADTVMRIRTTSGGIIFETVGSSLTGD